MNDVLLKSRGLGATTLREANRKRAKLWHPTPESEWTPRQWFKALLGEIGEAADADKKLDRFSGGAAHIGADRAALAQALGDEIADSLIYLDLLAESVGVRPEFLWNYDYPPCETSQYQSSEDIFLDLAIDLGHLGFSLRYVQDRTAETYSGPTTQKYIRSVQKYLLILGQFHGLDLSRAVQDKFNAVSNKYGFPVRV